MDISPTVLKKLVNEFIKIRNKANPNNKSLLLATWESVLCNADLMINWTWPFCDTWFITNTCSICC